MLLIRMVLLLTGLLMTVVPGACTRKDQRGDLNAEKGYGRLASGLSAAAVIWIITAKFF
ncbi:MAG: permease [Roseburia inulinivorans]